jgi:hypothetical protein
MFPRSKRPVSKARCSWIASAAKPTAYTAMPAQTASGRLTTRCQSEVAERAALDADEEAVELDD